MLVKEKRKQLGYIFTIAAAICWGFSGACGEFLFQHRGLNPEWVTMVRMILTGVAMLPILLYSKGRNCVICPLKDKGSILRLLVFSIVGLASCQYTYLAVIKYSNAGTGTMLQYIGPVFVMLFICLIEKRMPKIKELIALIIVILGIFLVATHGDVTNLKLTKTALVFGLLSAITLALYTILPIKLIREYGSTLVTSWAMLIGGALVGLIFNPSVGERAFFDIGTYLGLIGIILVGTLFSYTVFLYGVSLLGPMKASLLACIEPISAAIFSVLWFGTKFTYYDYLGFFFIILAVGIVSLEKK